MMTHKELESKTLRIMLDTDVGHIPTLVGLAETQNNADGKNPYCGLKEM